jgi:anti-sigma factor RsiW
MTCIEWREMLLEADRAELEGSADTVLARHIAECAECRRLATHILASERDLARALDGFARAESLRRPPARSRRTRAVLVATASLAAAAALAAILVLRPPRTAPLQLTVTPAIPPIVETGSDRDFAVITTDNPDIVVVWFLEGD